MRYTVGELAKMSGVSARTLRLYDENGLLRPLRDGENGYRLYDEGHVDRLQQILFYRELGVGLAQIGQLLDAPDFDRRAALQEHYGKLLCQQEHIGALLRNVQKTIQALNGGQAMSNEEKFEGFKREKLEENERRYGRELRRAYGDQVVDASQKKVGGMSEKQWNTQNQRAQRINQLLTQAMAEGDPAGETARELCQLHGEWLSAYWPDGMYTPEAHRAMCEGYLADERFTAYYDNACGKGATAFLCQAVKAFTQARE